MINAQKGFTLLEMILVISLMAGGTLLAFWDKQTNLQLQKAQQVGSYIYQYNNAVRNFLAKNPDIASGSRSGTAWLKNTSCGGFLAIGSEYLPCSFPIASVATPIPFGRISFNTVIDATGVAPKRKLTATTITEPFTLSRNGTPEVRSDLSAVAAIAAAAGGMTGYKTDTSGGVTPYGATTDASFNSDPLTARITMVSSNRADNDIWLRTDGGNKMHASLAFEDADPLNRQILGTSRIQNLASQALYIGSPTGIAPISGAAVIVDANQETIGNLRVRNSLTVDNGASVTGNVTASNNISAGGSVSAAGNVTASNNISAGASISAAGNGNIGGAVVSQIFYDSNNTGFYLDPNNTSNLNALQTNSINSNGRIRAGEFLDLAGVASENTGCAPNGLIGRDWQGKLLSCQSGIWKGGTATASAIVRTGNPVCSCAADEVRTGCSGKQSGSYDTYAVEPNMCVGESGPAQCICTSFN
jgi:prepilin-type N-terminal cleavage/methylation domain-containing protein